jgi:hypothetical protein
MINLYTKYLAHSFNSSGFSMLFSTSSDNNSNNLNPVATYSNPDIQKDQIYSENKGKSGIYR